MFRVVSKRRVGIERVFRGSRFVFKGRLGLFSIGFVVFFGSVKGEGSSVNLL